MRLAVLQASAVPGAVSSNLARLDAALERAAAAGADLLVSPELFATAYAMDPAAGGEDLTERLAARCAVHGVAHVWSQPLPTSSSTVSSTRGGGAIGAVAADAGGAVLGQYRKVHLWGSHERAAFTPGEAPPLVVEVAGTSVAVALCYDAEFPETARAAAVAGAEVLAVPTAMDDAHVADVLLPARALENGLVLAYANHAGGPGGTSGGAFCGRSVVIGADGVVLARAEREGDALLLADVDPVALAAAREDNPYLSALRPGTYAGWPSGRGLRA